MRRVSAPSHLRGARISPAPQGHAPTEACRTRDASRPGGSGPAGAALLAHVPSLAVIGLLALPSLFWLRPGHVYSWLESYFPLTPRWALHDHLYLWNQRSSGGRPDLLFALLPFDTLFATLERLSGSVAGAQRLWLLVQVMAPGLAMYGLICAVGRPHVRRSAALMGATFYMFNLALIQTFQWTPTYPWAFAIVPAALAVYAHTLREGVALHRVALFIFVLALAAPLMSVPGMYFLVPIVLALFTVFSLLVGDRQERLRIVALDLVATPLYLLTNLWLIFPLSRAYGSFSGGATEYSQQVLDSWSLLNAFKVLTSYFFNKSRIQDEPSLFFPYSPFYYHPAVQALLVLLAVLAFSSLLRAHVRQVRGVALFGASLALIGMFFGKDIAPPAGYVVQWLRDHVSLFTAYRSTDVKFPLLTAMGYALLLPFGWAPVAAWVRSRAIALGEYRGAVIRPRVLNTILVALPVLVLAGLGFPLITGAVLPTKRPGLKSYQVEIPPYWQDASAWIEDHAGPYGVFVLPMNTSYADAYTWDYAGPRLLEVLTRRRVLTAAPGGGSALQDRRMNDVLGKVYRRFLEGDGSSLVEDLRPFGVRYVVNRRDVDGSYFGQLPDFAEANTPPEVQRQLDGDSRLSLVATFGAIDIYELAPEYVTPPVYASAPDGDQTVAPAMGGGDAVGQTTDAPPFIPPSSTGVRILDTRVDPTLLRVQVQADAPYTLVFNESFDDGWRAFIQQVPAGGVPQTLSMSILGFLTQPDAGAPVPSSAHQLVNGFANGWSIDQTGAYELIIRYEPQRRYATGAIISVGSWCLLLGALLGRIVLRRRLLVGHVRWSGATTRRVDALT